MAFLPSLRLFGRHLASEGRVVFARAGGSESARYVRRGLSEMAVPASRGSRKPEANIIKPNGEMTREVPRNLPSFRLAPSDFAFLWKECKRCFYLKSHGLLYRPRSPFPSVFNKIDSGMKQFFAAKRTESVLPDMPPGEFLCEEEDAWVESEFIDVGRNSLVFIRGKIDCLCLNDDGTYSIIDFKTSEISKYLDMYGRQLHAYAMALEFPSKKSEILQGKVTNMGLVVYQPTKFGFIKSAEKNGQNAVANLEGECQYHPIKKDFKGFFKFIEEVVDVLEGEMPEPGRDCSCCKYLRDAERNDYTKF